MNSNDWPLFYSKTMAIRCDDTKGIVALRGERTIAGAAFDNWTRTSCQMHIWVQDVVAIRHGFITEICDYVFNTCGRRMLFGMIPANNPKSIKFATHAGMREVFRVVDGFAEGVDYILMRMDKDTCRWINGKEGPAGYPRLRWRSERAS